MAFFSWMKKKPKAVRYESERALRDAVISVLRADPAFSDVEPDPENETSIRLRAGDHQLASDIGNLFDYLKCYPEENAEYWIEHRRREIHELISLECSPENLILLVRSQAYVDGLAEIGVQLMTEPLAGDLVQTYGFDHPTGVSPAPPEKLASLGSIDLKAVATVNLSRLMDRLVAENDGVAVLYYLEDNSVLSPGLLMLEEFWTIADRRFPEGAIVVNPRRDQIFLIDKRDESAAESARRIIDAAVADDYLVQSERLYHRTAGKLVPFEN